MKTQPNVQTPITHEQGGLEADVSGYSGLLKISGGATSQASPGVDYYGPGVGMVPVSDGGTGASDAAGARTNLDVPSNANLTAGLAGKQDHSGLLNEIAGLSVSPGDILYVNSSSEITNLGKGSNGQSLTLVSGFPAWSDSPTPPFGSRHHFGTTPFNSNNYLEINTTVDSGGGMTTYSNHGFTVPESGHYYISYNTDWAYASGSAAALIVNININGTNQTIGRSHAYVAASSSTRPNVAGSGVFYMTSGQYVRLYAIVGSVNLYLDTATLTTFRIDK